MKNPAANARISLGKASVRKSAVSILPMPFGKLAASSARHAGWGEPGAGDRPKGYLEVTKNWALFWDFEGCTQLPGHDHSLGFLHLGTIYSVWGWKNLGLGRWRCIGAAHYFVGRSCNISGLPLDASSNPPH